MYFSYEEFHPDNKQEITEARQKIDGPFKLYFTREFDYWTNLFLLSCRL
jgi:hypothetical protein